MDEQKTTDNWLDKEIETFSNKNTETFEQLPSLKLVPEEDTIIDIDFSKPFNKWKDDSDPKNLIIKAIIPCTKSGVKHNFWLNIKNPLYAEIVRAGKKGQTRFKIHQEGKLKQTRYSLLPF